ncbi:MAG: PLP-dependent transferase [Anaerolineae bacterium]|nr:PLP-dependent transferase [Anaerolineae bacterium]
MEIETNAIHAGHEPDPASGAIVPPIHLTTTYEREADGTYPHGFTYSRTSNPNRAALEANLAALEGGAEAVMLASGSAAMMTLFQALQPGDHVLAPDNLYFGIRKLLEDVFAPWGLESTFVDMTDLNVVERAFRPGTRLVVIETPSNPQLKITDIQAAAALAHGHGALLACDNTIATPVLQHPLEHGADLVIHATTKYLGGHSDVMGGAIVARENSPLLEKIKVIQNLGGAIPSPFECWLTLRGIQTLPYRVRAQAANALKIARFLESHPKVEKVLYPGLAAHEGHEIAGRQMSAFGGLMSMLVKGGQDEAMTVAARVQLFTRATSFGGPHSLIEHRASIEAPGTKTPPNLLRLSIGLENVEDLIADLTSALL